MTRLVPAGAAGSPVAEPLPANRKWRAITLSTLLLVPAFWFLLAGLVGLAAEDAVGGPNAAAAIALGLALIPFAFLLLAFLSQHPAAPMAVVKAMGLCLLVGIPASALAADAVTGLVAGVGAGGIVALRADEHHEVRSRAVAVLLAAGYTFLLARTVAELALLPAPALPFTAIGVADHVSEWRADRRSERG